MFVVNEKLDNCVYSVASKERRKNRLLNGGESNLGLLPLQPKRTQRTSTFDSGRTLLSLL